MFSINKKNLPIVGLMAFLVLLFVFYFQDMFVCRFDSGTFYITGKRILGGNVLNIYSPIEGSGPFVYTPLSLSFFVVMSYISAQSYQVLSFIALLGIIYKIYIFLLDNKLSVLSSFIISFNIVIMYLAVFWESIFIGQIDLLLLFIIVSVFLKSERNVVLRDNFILFTEILFLSLIISLKPQFIFLYLIYLIYNKNNIKSSILFILVVNLFFILFLIYINEFSIILSIDLIKLFLQNALHVSANLDVTNQSFFAFQERVFSDIHNIRGRYYPDLFVAPLMIKNSIFYIFLMISVGILVITINMFASSNIGKSSHFHIGYYLLSLLLSAMPTILPLYWQVHSVYLLFPIIFIMSILYPSNKQLSFIFLIICSLLMLMSNFYIIGKYIADYMLYFGSTYIVSLFVLCINLILIYKRYSTNVTSIFYNGK